MFLGNRRLSVNVKSPDHPGKEKKDKGAKEIKREKSDEKGKDEKDDKSSKTAHATTGPLRSPRAPGFRKGINKNNENGVFNYFYRWIC